MEDFRGTKGEWTYKIDGENMYGVQQISINCENIESLALVYNPTDITETENEGIHNAKLIAAAPELLEALIALQNAAIDTNISASIQNKAVSAINKALSH